MVVDPAPPVVLGAAVVEPDDDEVVSLELLVGRPVVLDGELASGPSDPLPHAEVVLTKAARASPMMAERTRGLSPTTLISPTLRPSAGGPDDARAAV